MTADAAPLTRADLREELALFRDEIRTHYATKADLKELELRLLVRLGGLIAIATGVVIAVDRLVT